MADTKFTLIQKKGVKMFENYTAYRSDWLKREIFRGNTKRRSIFETRIRPADQNLKSVDKETDRSVNWPGMDPIL